MTIDNLDGRIVSMKIVQIRKELGLTQEKFAKILKISRTYLARLETQYDVASNISVKLIQELESVFCVNLDWFFDRYDDVDMFKAQDKNEVITDFMADILNEPDESFKKRFIAALSQMTSEQWRVIADFCDKLKEQ